MLYLHCLYNSWFCVKNGSKNHPQVYLEECEYKVKQVRTPRFINIELESDSEPDVEEDLDSNTTTTTTATTTTRED